MEVRVVTTIIVFGPPGATKDTNCEKALNHVPHSKIFSFSNALRTFYGKGSAEAIEIANVINTQGFVRDELVIPAMENGLKNIISPSLPTVLFMTGLRTIGQGRALYNYLPGSSPHAKRLFTVIWKPADEIAIERMVKRGRSDSDTPEKAEKRLRQHYLYSSELESFICENSARCCDIPELIRRSEGENFQLFCDALRKFNVTVQGTVSKQPASV